MMNLLMQFMHKKNNNCFYNYNLKSSLKYTNKSILRLLFIIIYSVNRVNIVRVTNVCNKKTAGESIYLFIDFFK